MKQTLKTIAFTIAFIAIPVVPIIAQSTAQPEKEQRGEIVGEVSGQDPKTKKSEQKEAAPADSSSQAIEQLERADTSKTPSGVTAGAQAGRRSESSEEEAAIVPYYNMYLTNYHLGPDDIISVDIFNQPRYSKAGITVPPNGKISYPLIPEGVNVVGKTTEEVQEEIKKRLDEYIIDPQVTVFLDKAVSATYSVVGDVAQPGVRTMTRRYSITEALAMAGGVLETGDKSKVVILRRQADGNVSPILVNVKKIEKGQAKEMAFLVPGDQVVVPGNKLKILDKIMKMVPILSFARVFTGGW